MMNNPARTLVTLSPIYTPLNVALGLDQSSPKYTQLLAKIPAVSKAFRPIHQAQQETNFDYDKIDIDARDNRILLWECAEQPDLKIHVYPNNIAVVEITLQLDSALSASDTEKQCQDSTVELVDQVYPQFVADIMRLQSHDQDKILTFDHSADIGPKLLWVSRAYLPTRAQLMAEENQDFMKDWLSNTQRPEDAIDIIAGKKRYSMTWLNYVVVDAKAKNPHINTMILAQYFYTAQENCNKQLKCAIDNAYSSKSLLSAEKQLATSRVLSRLHQIDFHEHQKYLNRFKRKLLDEILGCWDFEQLTENGQRMIEVCTSRLEEADNKKRERSTIMTDLLLVTLSFFAVFELSLYLTELSREMMSRPALAYHDEKSSLFLNAIAGVHVDIMIGLGFGLTLALILVYRKIKSK